MIVIQGNWSRRFCRSENFTFIRSVWAKCWWENVALLSSVVYYFGDLLHQQIWLLYGTKKTHQSLIWLLIIIIAHLEWKKSSVWNKFCFYRRETLPSRLEGNTTSSNRGSTAFLGCSGSFDKFNSRLLLVLLSNYDLDQLKWPIFNHTILQTSLSIRTWWMGADYSNYGETFRPHAHQIVKKHCYTWSFLTVSTSVVLEIRPFWGERISWSKHSRCTW